jgi:hypothetical protein
MNRRTCTHIDLSHASHVRRTRRASISQRRTSRESTA